MSQRAKLFKSGGSQAVRLPREFRFDQQEEVLIYRQGNRIVLEPVRRTWSPEFLALAGSAPDFPYPDDPPPADPGPELE
ncbi:MAG TPA: type II toxin-antitoxin system VapB family antitoxin [Thermoanaerobaculia bacterium]|jgi:antitoxin VapB|nr:type II toxin-antitoxin system VapB family antitoxin [Thermoanaerobaculia bacterium]